MIPTKLSVIKINKGNLKIIFDLYSNAIKVTGKLKPKIKAIFMTENEEIDVAEKAGKEIKQRILKKRPKVVFEKC